MFISTSTARKRGVRGSAPGEIVRLKKTERTEKTQMFVFIGAKRTGPYHRRKVYHRLAAIAGASPNEPRFRIMAWSVRLPATLPSMPPHTTEPNVVVVEGRIVGVAIGAPRDVAVVVPTTASHHTDGTC